MKTNTQTKSFLPKMTSTKEKTSISAIIVKTGILFTAILFLLKISWGNIDWKIMLIPLMIALQIVFLSSAIKNRYKKI